MEEPADTIDFNALGQACDTTWGRSSTPKTASYSVKFTVSRNVLMATYGAIVSFSSMNDVVRVKKNYAEEAQAITKDAVKHVKDAYKKLTGKALKLMEIDALDTVEVINSSFVNPKKTAYFRRKTMFEVA